MKYWIVSLVFISSLAFAGGTVSIESGITPDAASVAATLVADLSERVADGDKKVTQLTIGNETRYILQDDDVTVQCSEFSPGGNGGIAIQIQRYSCKFSTN